MQKLILSVIVTVLVLTSYSARAETPAQCRVKAANELQNTFDNSVLKGWKLKFVVRGNDCDVLHVEGYTNLEEGMMKALGYGTLIYGKILPGGVNSFAFHRGFRDVVYSNSGNDVYVTFGSTKLTSDQVRNLRLCSDQIAEELKNGVNDQSTSPQTPQLEQLSSSNAKAGTKLYDGAYRHQATIVYVDRAKGIIMVKFLPSGSIEPKLLSAVAPYWYVRK